LRKSEPPSAKFCLIVAKCLRKREPRQIPRSLFHKSRSALCADHQASFIGIGHFS
jgi:hypothetical protein